MNLFKKISTYFNPRKIIWRTTLWSWALILITILVFVGYNFPFQKNTVLNRMDNEAEDIASSIQHANSSALIMEDYGALVDHCYKLVNESKSILYVVVTKKDGFSLIHKMNNWEIDTLKGFWLPQDTHPKGTIIYSKLLNSEVFHKSYKISFSGVDWGWIHIGLSLSNYERTLSSIKSNTIWLTIVMSILGLIISFMFARKLTKPITILDLTTKKITRGDMNAVAEIKTGDELESLASSFNQMTSSLRIARENLEDKVMKRTLQLEETNKTLLKEIYERKKIENSLHSSIKEKDVLLKEIHHRVKNNLQIITSLFSLQSRYITDEENLAVFRDSQNRIKSMALVHEKLYQSNDFSKIDLKEYVINLSSYIQETYSNENNNAQFIFDMDNVELPLDVVVPLGLILNELISNAYKYAFKNFESGKENFITIKSFLNKINKRIISIEDNGIGLPKDFDIETVQSLGLKLVYNLCAQIEAELNIEANNGTKFTILLS